MIRILVVEDHEIVRIGLSKLFEADSEIEVVGEAGSGEAALEIATATQPDVVLLDMRLPDCTGVDVCRELANRSPDAKVLILTSFADKRTTLDAMSSGAVGFMMKDGGAVKLRDAVHSIASGEIVVDPIAMEWLMRSDPQSTMASRSGNGDTGSSLTPRQGEILELIGEGMTNQEIANKVNLNLQTVKNYVSAILAKLGMSHRSEAAAHVARQEVQPLNHYDLPTEAVSPSRGRRS